MGKIATKKNIEKANEMSEFLLSNKSLLIVVGASVLGFIAYRQIKKTAGAVSDAVSDVFADVPTDHISADVNVNNQKTTITKEKAVILAKSLLDAFNDTTFFGSPATDERKVEYVFDQLKTGDDFRLVYNIFGKRKIINGGTPTTWFDKKIANEYDLIYWLKAEISETWDSSLFNKIKDRVQSAGMPF